MPSFLHFYYTSQSSITIVSQSQLYPNFPIKYLITLYTFALTTNCASSSYGEVNRLPNRGGCPLIYRGMIREEFRQGCNVTRCVGCRWIGFREGGRVWWSRGGMFQWRCLRGGWIGWCRGGWFSVEAVGILGDNVMQIGSVVVIAVVVIF